MATFLCIDEPAARSPKPPAFALWQLGFRPFYLLASLYAALSVGLWGLQFTGVLPLPYLRGPLWHAHEMLMGFALPVIVGFLFTAGRNWTGQPTPTGGKLMALAAAGSLAVPLWRARSRRNYFFVLLLLGLGMASLAMHLAQQGLLRGAGDWAEQLALDLVLFVLCVMGGRVIPMFTNNGVPGARARRKENLDRAALAAVLAVQLPPDLRAPLLAAAAALHLARWWLWQPWTTLRTPLVGVLHLAYAWIPVHLALRALSALGWVTPSLAHHALTVGAVGGMVIGMMVRTARGHTARPLRADRWELACFALVAAAALLRVLLPLAAPGALMAAVAGSALLWSLGFGLYAWRYLPILTRPRLDGKPG